MPSFISITRIAISARFPPLFLSDVKAAWPGLSINNNPGIVRLSFSLSKRVPHIFFIVFSWS